MMALLCVMILLIQLPQVVWAHGALSFAGNGLVVYHGEQLGLVLVS
jgi:hypothetical protein